MRELRPRCCHQEALGHEAGQLRLHVVGHFFRRMRVFQLARGGRIVDEHLESAARDFVGDQGQAPSPFVDAAAKACRIGGQCFGEERAVERELDDLFAQLVGGAERHEEDRHLLQVGDVPLEVLQRVADLQRDEAAQAGAVLDCGDIGLVEDFDDDMADLVDECGETDKSLVALADFHQLGELAEGPVGVDGSWGGLNDRALTPALSQRERE